MATQTYAALTNAQRNTYNMALLKRALPLTPMFQRNIGGPVIGRIPERGGTTMEFRIWGGTNVGTTGAGLALATTALTEGSAPADTGLVVAKTTKAVSQYGAWAKISDLLAHQAIDPVWTETSELLGEQAGQTLHTLLVNDLAAGTNVIYASTATSRVTVAAAMVLTGTDIRRAVRALARAKVPRFGDGYYHGLIHVNQAYDLRNDADWKNMNIYAGGSADGGNSMIRGEIGALHGVKFWESTDAPLFAGAGAAGIDVYGALIFGPNWFGTVDLAAYPTPAVTEGGDAAIRFYGVPVDTATKDDPLGQFGTAGWKTSYGGVILRPWAGIRLETSVTA